MERVGDEAYVAPNFEYMLSQPTVDVVTAVKQFDVTSEPWTVSTEESQRAFHLAHLPCERNLLKMTLRRAVGERTIYKFISTTMGVWRKLVKDEQPSFCFVAATFSSSLARVKTKFSSVSKYHRCITNQSWRLMKRALFWTLNEVWVVAKCWKVARLTTGSTPSSSWSRSNISSRARES